jgi:hypothetical protein
MTEHKNNTTAENWTKEYWRSFLSSLTTCFLWIPDLASLCVCVICGHVQDFMGDIYGRSIDAGILQNIEVLKHGFIGPYIDTTYSLVCQQQ